MTPDDRRALREWEDFHANMHRNLSVDLNETALEKKKRMADLESDFEKWAKHYFPNYATAEPAPFHKRSAKRIIKNKRWFEIISWSRELAKSTRTMILVLYLVLALEELKNIILTSSSGDNAIRLLTPFRIALEKNERIKNDYGTQKLLGQWRADEFVTKKGVSFRALGAGESPRGTRNEAARPDCILIDDMDTDEETRNEERIKKKVEWIERALIPTLSVSGNYRIIVCGNIIAKYCCVTLLQANADHVDIVNIRDKNGKSTWSKNSEKDIDRFLSMISYSAQQGEYFNNPITEGSVFKSMAHKPARPLRDYKFLVCYTDPSFKDTKKNDFKATVLVGRYKSEIHVIKAFVEQTSTKAMIDWHYEIDTYVGGRVPVYYYMEANFLQDTILDEFAKTGQKKGMIPIKGDDRKKADKFTRIESLLEPLNSRGLLYLNEREENNPHMVTLKDQFLALNPKLSAHDDGPDAVEGAVWIINEKLKAMNPDAFNVIKRPRSHKKRF